MDPIDVQRLLRSVPIDGISSVLPVDAGGLGEPAGRGPGPTAGPGAARVVTRRARGAGRAPPQRVPRVRAARHRHLCGGASSRMVDRGEPAQQRGGGPRSCQTYVPGIRRTVRFDRAEYLGRGLGRAAFTERYCWCNFCVGALDAGQDPLDLLLESQIITDKRGRERQTPTGRATTLNTYHYLHARRQEIEAFSRSAATEVVQEDIDRASALAGPPETGRLSDPPWGCCPRSCRGRRQPATSAMDIATCDPPATTANEVTHCRGRLGGRYGPAYSRDRRSVGLGGRHHDKPTYRDGRR